MRKIKKWSKKQQEEILFGHAGSELSVAKYCEKRGVHKSTFYAWRKKLIKPKKIQRQGFVKIKAIGLGSTAPIIVETPEKYRIEIPEGSSEDLIQRVIHSVRIQ